MSGTSSHELPGPCKKLAEMGFCANSGVACAAVTPEDPAKVIIGQSGCVQAYEDAGHFAPGLLDAYWIGTERQAVPLSGQKPQEKGTSGTVFVLIPQNIQ